MQLLGGVFYSCEMREIYLATPTHCILKAIPLSSFNKKYLKYEQSYAQVKVEMKIDREEKFCFQRSAQSFWLNL